MREMKMHESLVDVVDNGDGTFTISRGKLVSLVQGQVFMDIYDDADVDEVESGMEWTARIAACLAASLSPHRITRLRRLRLLRLVRSPDKVVGSVARRPHGVGYLCGRRAFFV